MYREFANVCGLSRKKKYDIGNNNCTIRAADEYSPLPMIGDSGCHSLVVNGGDMFSSTSNYVSPSSSVLTKRKLDADNQQNKRPRGVVVGKNEPWTEIRAALLPIRRSVLLKAVEQFDLRTGKVIAIYPSMYKAECATGAAKGSISMCCCGIFSHAGGFGWRLFHPANDSNPDIQEEEIEIRQICMYGLVTDSSYLES